MSIPDDEGREIEYLHCPLRFITRSAASFIERLDYLDAYPHTAPPFDEVDPRWRAFKTYYDGKLAEYQRQTERRK